MDTRSDKLNTKMFGDIAFRDEDFNGAVEYHSKTMFHGEMENTSGLTFWSFVASQPCGFS